MRPMCIFICLFCSLAMAGGKAFRDMPLADALKRAEVENKAVFVDFYTTWCGPCKMMDRTTFQDPKVVSWLEAHTIPLAIDAEAQVEIAQKYKIASYPSLVFLKADGSVALKVTGYHNATQFLEVGERVRSGNRPDQAARQALAAQPDNVALKFAYAKSLIEVGQTDEAFEQCRQILAAVQTDQAGALNHFDYYFTIRQTGGQAGIELLKGEYERVLAKINAGDITAAGLGDYALLAGLTRGKSALVLYDELKASGTAAEKLALFKDVLIMPLTMAGRFDEIDALEPIEQRVANLDQIMASFKGQAKEAEMINQIMSQKTKMYRILRSMNADERADRLATKILAEAQTARVYNGLAWSDYEAKRLDQRSLAWAERANELSGGNNTDILDTYARVLAGLGQAEKAVSVLKAALAVLPEGEGREVVQTCLDELSKS